MFITINNLNIFYNHHIGDTSETTVILHGWGANSQTMQSVFDNLKQQNKSVISLDLPFFGQSDPPPSSWKVFDYADIVEKFIIELNLQKINLLCHSFGVRVAIILAGTSSIKSRIKKMIFTGGAGLKPKRSIKYYFKIYSYKIKKKLRLKNNIKKTGSTDYISLPDFMKPVFVHVVNTHLDKLLKKIEIPTLLIWGENDTATPLYMAKKMECKIVGSALIIIENASHYAFLDNPNQFNAIVNAFI
ncbi:MAG: alpha/beta hydrolase [Firmicutes bacterium]|nr:alpha/beta hydrolase [Bacillota bacterium]